MDIKELFEAAERDRGASRFRAAERRYRAILKARGLSLLDKPGAPYHDPRADAALFEAIESTVHQTEKRRIERLPYDINHPAFADALVKAFNEITR